LVRVGFQFPVFLADRDAHDLDGRADHVDGALLASGPLGVFARFLYPGGRISTAGGTGDAPVCCARWWDGRRDMASPMRMALPNTIKPMATAPAISTISIWTPMVYASRAFR
jgi:hypothetical protein